MACEGYAACTLLPAHKMHLRTSLIIHSNTRARAANDFYTTSIEFTPMSTLVPTEIKVEFIPLVAIDSSDYITVSRYYVERVVGQSV